MCNTLDCDVAVTSLSFLVRVKKQKFPWFKATTTTKPFLVPSLQWSIWELETWCGCLWDPPPSLVSTGDSPPLLFLLNADAPTVNEGYFSVSLLSLFKTKFCIVHVHGHHEACYLRKGPTWKSHIAADSNSSPPDYISTYYTAQSSCSRQFYHDE